MERATAAERLLWRRLLAMLRRVKVSRCYFNDHIYYCTESALTPVWDQGLQCCSTSATASLLFDLLPKNIRHTSNTFFFPQRCAGEWPILATSRRALTPDFYVWYLTFAFTIVPLPAKSWSSGEGGRNKQRLQIELSKWIHSTHLTNSLKAVQTFIVAAFGLNGRHTFSLCFRGGGGLSGALCLFTSSSIVDFAWVWGECMSLRDGLAAGVGTTSTPLSPGDFLRHKHTRTHTVSKKAVVRKLCCTDNVLYNDTENKDM